MVKIYKLITVVLIIVINSFSEGNEYADTILPMCTFPMVEQCFKDKGFNWSSFEKVINDLNWYYCKIDTTTLIKYVRLYVLRMLHAEKIDSNYTYVEQRNIGAAWGLALDKKIWCSEIEHIVEKQMLLAKKRKNYKSYYGSAGILVRKSSNWFYYAMEVYNTNDTVLHYERNLVFKELIRRFDKNSNPAELQKVEAVLYAVLKNNNMSDIKTLDMYLADKSAIYKNSKQRKEIVDERDNFYKTLKNKNEKNYQWILKYFNEVRDYLKSLHHLNDYTPLLVIE